MKKNLLIVVALCLIISFCSAQGQDYVREWRIGYGPQTLCGIPSGHTNPAGTVAYDFGELVLDASLWNPLDRVSIGPQMSLFGTYLIPHPDDPNGSLFKFGLGARLGLEAQIHLLPNHVSATQRWNLTLNTALCLQYTRFLPIDYTVGITLKAIWYPFEQWGIYFEAGLNTILWGQWRYFNPLPLNSNSILRFGVSHRF
ncbi:MAG: hypothetical protein IJ524_02945 [Bacteroidales bacterium]|nr:hypothetical protein [Bacteroidales bacterium]